MDNFVAPQNAKITDVKGVVRVDSNNNALLDIGDNVEAGTTIVFSKGSEVTFVFDDGSQQRVSSHTDASDETLTIESLSNNESPNNEDLTANTNTQDDVLDEISEIQTLIESGDDVELPDTAAGGEVDNEGGDYVTLDRNADETLAEAGYDTAESNNDLPATEDTALEEASLPFDFSDANESVTTPENTPITGNILLNVSSANGTPVITNFSVNGASGLTAGTTANIADAGSVVVDANVGSIVVNADGSYIFTPADDFNGSVPSITYSVTDGVIEVSSTLNIEVTPVFDDADEDVSTPEITPISGNVLDNVSSVDGPTTITTFSVDGETAVAAGTTTNIADIGSIVINTDGSYIFTPVEDFNGSVPNITYTVADVDLENDSVLTIAVTPAFDDADENVSTPEIIPISGNVLDNVSSVDGPTSVTTYSVRGSTPVTAGTTTNIDNVGTIVINTDGSYQFTPVEDFNGNVPSIDYTVADDELENDSTLTIEVTPVFDDADENVSTPENTPISGNVLDNVTSADGPTTVTTYSVNGGTTVTPGTTTNIANVGSIVINTDGSYTFSPVDDYNGTVPSIDYTVADGDEENDSTLNINVTPAFADGDESVTTAANTPINGNVLLNVTSADGTPTVTTYSVNGATEVSAGTTTNIANVGSIFINSNGNFQFNPFVGFSGSVPNISYTVADGAQEDDSTLSISVTPPTTTNLPPVAEDDVFSIIEGGLVEGNVIAHHDGDLVVDTDGNGDDLFITHANGTVIAETGFTEVTLTNGNGSILINAQGDFSYDNNDIGFDENSTIPSFSYTLSDGTNTDNATVTINVEVSVPIANNDTRSAVLEGDLVNGAESVVITGNIIASGGIGDVADISDDAPIILTRVTFGTDEYVFDEDNTEYEIDADYGVLIINNTGAYTYTSDNDLDIPDSTLSEAFNYVIQDSDTAKPDSDDATLTINLTPDISYLPPVAEDDFFSVNEGETVRGNVIEHSEVGNTRVDTDGGDGDTLSITQVDGTDLNFEADDENYATIAIQDGILRINAQGEFTYSNTGFTVGSDSPTFEYTLDDDTPAPTDIGKVTINIIDTAPVANDDTRSLELKGDVLSGAESVTIKGNVITGSSTGDVEDTSADGSVTLTKVIFGTDEYVFDEDNTEHEVDADYGILKISSDGTYTYTSELGIDIPDSALSEAFTYFIEDSDVVRPESDSATLTINLTPNLVNLPPVAEDDVFSMNEGELLEGNVIAHSEDDNSRVDTDGGDGGLLFITHANGVPVEDTGYTEIPLENGNGSIFINADGDFSYDNSGIGFDVNSTPPSFSYTLSDGTDIDNATVTINVGTTSPVANPDNNYMSLIEHVFFEGTVTVMAVEGNVITLESSGDVSDTSSDGAITLTKVTYGGVDYDFDAIAFHTIPATYGTLTIYDTGNYTYITTAGLSMPATDVNETFTYTIKDGDEYKPDTDTTTLTIHLEVPEVAADPAPVDPLRAGRTSSIDTSNLEKDSVQDNSSLQDDLREYGTGLDLSDLITYQSTSSLDQYLQFDGEIQESTGADNESIEASVEEMVLAETEQSAEHQNVTNGLLAEGAVIISDNTAQTAPPLAEMDSTDLL